MKLQVSRLFISAIVAASVAGCGAQGAPPNQPLSISNGTTIPVTIVVNGANAATVAPKTDQEIASASLPALPWTVEARTSRGRLLSAMTVHAGDVVMTAGASGSTLETGDGVRVDLSCGRLDVWYGPPLLGPMPGPGSPGDCDP